MTIDILPFAASGIALLPSARRTLESIYQSAPARFASAAEASPHRNARVLHAGRAETDRACMQALGVLQGGTQSEIKRLLRAALRPVYDCLSKITPGTDFSLDSLSPFFSGDADIMCAQIYVTMAICSVFGLKPRVEGEVGEIVSFFFSNAGRGLEARTKVTKEKVSLCAKLLKEQCGQSIFTGWQDVADAFSPIDIDYEIAALEHGGIDIGIYTMGISSSQNDVPYLLGKTPRESFLLTTLFLLGKAIKQDKAAALSAYRRQDEAAIAVDRLNAVERRANAAERRIASLEKELYQAQKAVSTALSEVQSHAGDAQELAALREALWNAAKPEDEPALPQEKTRELPTRTVIIGGHATWAKEMEKATGARAWPSGTTCPPQVVSAADEIWIQAAYMCHSEFFSVIDSARRLGKPVRYFPSTGLSRCLSAMRRKD